MKDNSIIDLNEYISLNDNVITITEDINEITLTSNGDKVNASVLVKPRSNDLTINIDNLYLESNENISIDMRGGKYYSYENNIVYTGNNKIISGLNIGVCISNNQTVNFIGKDNGLLEVIGGSGTLAIGNNEYTSGSGKIRFFGDGKIYAHGGNGKDDVCCANSGGEGICFYNEDTEESSEVLIYENADVNIRGGNGGNISTINTNCKAGNGGISGTSIKDIYEINPGGNGGNIINCNNNKCDIVIGNIIASYGKGGGINKVSSINNGRDGEKIRGENIVSFKNLQSLIYDENIDDLEKETKEIEKNTEENTVEVENEEDIVEVVESQDINKEEEKISDEVDSDKNNSNKKGIIFLIIDFLKKIFKWNK